MSWVENRHRKAETWQEDVKNTLLEKRLYEEQFPETKQGGDRRSKNFQVANLATCSVDCSDCHNPKPSWSPAADLPRYPRRHLAKGRRARFLTLDTSRDTPGRSDRAG